MSEPIHDDPARDEKPRRTGLMSAIDHLLRRRAFLYIVFIVAIAAWKLWPTLQSQVKTVKNVEKASEGTIIITGSDNAPGLVRETIAQFSSDYPKIEMSMSGGGTIAALEDLLNRRADVAILSRPPSPREIEIASEHGDSLLYFPVALGGISLLSNRSSGIASVSVDHLRHVVEGGAGASRSQAAACASTAPARTAGFGTRSSRDSRSGRHSSRSTRRCRRAPES